MRDQSVSANTARGMQCVQLVAYVPPWDKRGKDGFCCTAPSLCPHHRRRLLPARGEQHRAGRQKGRGWRDELWGHGTEWGARAGCPYLVPSSFSWCPPPPPLPPRHSRRLSCTLPPRQPAQPAPCPSAHFGVVRETSAAKHLPLYFGRPC